MSVSFVQRFEVIDIAQQQAHGGLAPNSTPRLRLHSLVKFTAVGHAREAILAREFLKFEVCERELLLANH